MPIFGISSSVRAHHGYLRTTMTLLTEAPPATLKERLAAEFLNVSEVALCLEAVELDCLSRRDRRGVFATAYLEITRAIGAALEGEVFDDPIWTGRYLICFANLYRRALLACETGDTGTMPKSWRIAFDAAREGSGLVLQHLMLGINAHINHDLALALGEVGIDPERPRRYDDHTKVNEVLERATVNLKREVSRKHAPILERLDWIAGRFDDEATKFSIPKAREHAWSFAVALAGARSEAERELLKRTLDEQASVLARLILAPTRRHPILLRIVHLAERIDAWIWRVLPLRR